MACDIDDREDESPSPMEPRLRRMFHSSATGRRRDQTLPETLGLRQALYPRGDTAGSASRQARTRSAGRPQRAILSARASEQRVIRRYATHPVVVQGDTANTPVGS